jgi:hypothetical protein
LSSTALIVGRVAVRSGKSPSKAWYWLAAAVVLLGVGCGVTWGVVSTMRAHDQATALPRTTLPGRLEVSAQAGSSRLIFFEGGSKPDPQVLRLSVTAPDGSPVLVRRYDLRMDYEIAGWVGTPVASFSAPVSGTYVVSADNAYRDGRISVGSNFVRTQAIDMVGALLLIASSVIVGLVIVLVVAVKRSRSPRLTRSNVPV